MKRHSQPLISAQVLLGSDGLSYASEISLVFKEAGFDVGQVIAGSFPITATPEIFKRFFDVNVEVTPAGKVTVIHQDGSSDLSLPLTALPERFRQEIQAIFFNKPPDFGPAAF